MGHLGHHWPVALKGLLPCCMHLYTSSVTNGGALGHGCIDGNGQRFKKLDKVVEAECKV